MSIKQESQIYKLVNEDLHVNLKQIILRFLSVSDS